MSIIIRKHRIHCYEDCLAVIPKKIDFINKWISEDELRLSVIGTLPMLKDQTKCPSCSRKLRRQYHDDYGKHKFKIINVYSNGRKRSRCSCGRTLLK